MDFKDLLRIENTFLIVGATSNENKFGFKVFQNLLRSYKKVYPINPNYKQILGIKCNSSIDFFENDFDVVVFVIPPDKVLDVLKNTTRKIKNIWLQPGSESEEIFSYCKEKNIFYVSGICIMVTKND